MHAYIQTYIRVFPLPHPLTLLLTHLLTLIHALLFSGEAVLMILQKDNAIKAWREFMGPTNSLTVPKP
jgi:hypothetical protein